MPLPPLLTLPFSKKEQNYNGAKQGRIQKILVEGCSFELGVEC